MSSITRNKTFGGGPPGTRTPNLRIKSLVEECWSESCTASELVVCRGVRVVSAADLVDAHQLAELENIQAFSFSACTFEIDGGSVIVYNPIRSEARRRSDIAHELSHLLLEHDLPEIREVAGVPFRTCRADQEEEATNLGGTLLLPRPLLLRAVANGMEPDDVATEYGVTIEMARFRLNTTAVARQLQRARARRAR